MNTTFQSYRRNIIVIAMITLVGIVLTKCMNDNKEKEKGIRSVEGKLFAGTASCAGCHKDIYQSHLRTAHWLTSQPASEQNIKGSFERNQNLFAFNEQLRVAMEKRPDGYYQVAYLNGDEMRAEKFDIVIGSGTKGQSYLHWDSSELVQLPITYFTPAQRWSNSPGNRDKLVFNRPITSRCLECHTTYAKKISKNESRQEAFDHTQLILGVTCERCHGPAAKHLSFQTEHPHDSVAKYIINPARLSRQQNIDLCALCHGGLLNKTKPSFSFQVGEKLSECFAIDTTGIINPLTVDVHGNQFGLLSASQCFIKSEMTCSSCHDPHVNEKGNLALFSQRCLNCHNNEKAHTCKMSEQIGASISRNCIDCHMPKEPSQSIVVFLQGDNTPTAALLRTHYITIYPNETKKVLSNISQLTTPEKK